MKGARAVKTHFFVKNSHKCFKNFLNCFSKICPSVPYTVLGLLEKLFLVGPKKLDKDLENFLRLLAPKLGDKNG